MSDDGFKIIARNRKARHEYHFDDKIEAGISLTGTEVKSLRAAQITIGDSYATVRNDEMWLLNCHINPYEFGTRYNHEPMRPRRLLMHKREIKKWRKALEQKGYTIIPLMFYLKAGKIKVQLGLGKGKKLYDKRADIADRESKRRLDRVMKSGRDD